MARTIDLDELVGFQEIKPSIKFYGKKWFVNKSSEIILRVKILDKKYKETIKNAEKSKNAEEKIIEANLNYQHDMFKLIFSEEQAKEISDLMLSPEQMEWVMKAVNSLFSGTEFTTESAINEEEKKTN